MMAGTPYSIAKLVVILVKHWKCTVMAYACTSVYTAVMLVVILEYFVNDGT